MNRTLKNLDKLQQSFIDTVYIQLKTFAQAAELLGVDIATIRKLNKDLETYLHRTADSRTCILLTSCSLMGRIQFLL